MWQKPAQHSPEKSAEFGVSPPPSDTSAFDSLDRASLDVGSDVISRVLMKAGLFFMVCAVCANQLAGAEKPVLAPVRKPKVSIVGDQFFINGKPTYQGRIWHRHK